MTDLAGRLKSVFLEPGPGGPAPAPAQRLLAVSAGVGVVGPGEAAPAVAAALALRLARRAGTPCALVAGVGLPDGPRAAARPAAVRTAATLDARAVRARASGRLVLAELDADHAAGDLARVAAAVHAPVVVLVAGPRTVGLDALLAEQDVLVLAPSRGTDPAVVELAAASLATLNPRVTVAPSSVPGPVRALALAGVAALGGLRAATQPALGVAG